MSQDANDQFRCTSEEVQAVEAWLHFDFPEIEHQDILDAVQTAPLEWWKTERESTSLGGSRNVLTSNRVRKRARWHILNILRRQSCWVSLDSARIEERRAPEVGDSDGPILSLVVVARIALENPGFGPKPFSLLRKGLGKPRYLRRGTLARGILASGAVTRRSRHVIQLWLDGLETWDIARRTNLTIRIGYRKVPRTLAQLRQELGTLRGSGRSHQERSSE